MDKVEKITIHCFSCGRTQTVRKHKVSPCDLYACSVPCKITGERWSLSRKEGFHFVEEMNAAGAFWGLHYEKSTEEDLAGFRRARAILKAGREYLKAERAVEGLLEDLGMNESDSPC